MLTEAIVFLTLLVLVSAFVKGGFVFTILYLFLGIYVVSLVWTRQSAKNISCERFVEKRIFWGEKILVRLEIKNKGWLPVPWLYLYESLPVELSAGATIKRVIGLRPHGRIEIPYSLTAFKRGYYQIGPFTARFGDTIGLTEIQELNRKPDYVTVYPRIIPINNLKLPSHSPQGTLKHHQPIFEDPTRVRGKRGYVAGDSLRRVDWKATAVTGQLQVKLFEPSIALQTAILLNMNSSEYPGRQRVDAIELAVVIAASLANWVVMQKQSVGLITNGVDPIADNRSVQPLPPRKGRHQLIHILDLLARIQNTNTRPFGNTLHEQTSHLSWGTTVVAITGHVDDALFDELFHVKRQGQDVVLILAGFASNLQKARQQAKQFGIPLYTFQNEKSLDIWRRK